MRQAAIVLVGLFLCGCSADYLNNYDTMTLASGNANHQNHLLQTVDPFNPASNNTHIEGDGVKGVAAVMAYKSGPTSSGGGYKGNCEYSDQSASDGSRCGGRSADARPGGYVPPPQY